MEKKQWVCHISGQGEKWLVDDANERVWIINEPCFMRLPKSEYRLCDPPEVWRDVTGECEVICGVVLSHQGADVNVADGYRLRKVELHPLNTLVGKQWAFIVEQKVSQ